jgi:8-oxo-dGTP pyrophosphatase MutT (NUDIX family)
VRETQEELGLPAEEVEVLGALAPVHTFVSAILIVPFVGMVAGDPVFVPSEGEIAEVLAYPLDELAAVETTVEWPRDGHVYRGFAYPMRDGNTIWGATAKILNEMIELLRGRP